MSSNKEPTTPSLSSSKTDKIIPTTEGDGYPKHISSYVNWEERIKKSAGYVACAFAYEISLPLIVSDISPLNELTVKPYQLLCTNRSMKCAVVENVPILFASIVFPGDIIVRINDDIFPSIRQPATIDYIHQSIQSSKYPKTIRFIRPAGFALQPSPAEAVVIAAAPNVTSKFEVNRTDSGLKLDMKAVDSKAPPVIKRMLQGNRINWEPFASKSNTSITNSKDDITSSYGVYKDRSRWVAVSKPKRSIHDVTGTKRKQDTRCFFLGRFDTEAEAVRACTRATEELASGRVLSSCRGGKVVPLAVHLAPVNTATSTALNNPIQTVPASFQSIIEPTLTSVSIMRDSTTGDSMQS